MLGFLERIKNGEIFLCDGAMGTLLFDKGVDPGQPPELVNLENPKILEEIAIEYQSAGADIIQTNSFGASPLRLSLYGLENRADEINRIAVESVRRAVGDSGMVSGSCGPSGKLLLPYGDTDPEKMYDSFKTQTDALIDAGVDLICIETMTDIKEALLAIKATRATSHSIPVMATMTFDRTPKGLFTIMGTSIEKAASELEKAGADIIGSNCGHGIEMMTEIAIEFKKLSSLPIIIQSNAGIPQIVEGKAVYDENPAFMAAKVSELLKIGISVIGGCCGTTPSHISAFRKAIDNYQA